MATILSDNFNRADADSLGATWTERGADFDIVSNEVKMINGGTTGYSSAYDSGSTYSSADYTVQVKTKTNSGGSLVGVAGRRVNYGTDDNDAYFASIRPSAGRVQILKRASGIASSVAVTDAETINFGTYYTVKLDMNGTTIKEFIDGSEILSATDSTHSAAGDAGLMQNDTNEGLQFWDDFLSEDASAGGATVPALDEGMLVGGMLPMGGGLD